MIYSADGTRRYSPRDLVAYLEGDFAAWCERMRIERGRAGGAGSSELEWVTPDEKDPELELVARMGDEHEKRYLASLRQRVPAMVELTRESPDFDTLAAMRTGAPAIYQAHLVDTDWHGYADFLIRAAGVSTFGDYLYVPWDTKLARSAKPYFLIQLCAYAELLEKIQGVRPSEIAFVLGDGIERRFKTDDFYYYYLALKARFVGFQTDWVVSPNPDPSLDKTWGRWTSWAERLLAESDHLSRVANITRGQVKRLEDHGITCFRALAASTDGHVDGITGPVLQQIQAQARLQLQSLGKPRPDWEPRPQVPGQPPRGLSLLPPPSLRDVFFDMEGFPYADGGLEYLWGAVTADGGSPVFHDWWAHGSNEERQALEAFIDWVWARWKQDPAMHIYHYASYEPSAVDRLKSRYGKHATCESKVDDLLRHDVFVDLYTIVRQGLIIGTASYALKDIERLYLPPREGDVVSAKGSVVEYQRWLDSGESRDWRKSPVLRGIRDYNQIDCESTRMLRDWLLQRQRQYGIAYLPESEAVRDERKTSDATVAAEQLAASLKVQAAGESDAERQRITELLGWLVEFHRREDRPMWWRMFSLRGKSGEELYREPDCLGNLTRTATPPRQIKRSTGLEYSYDPDQDTRLQVDDTCFSVGTDPGADFTITALDQEHGLIELKVGPKKSLPDHLSIIKFEHVGAETIRDAVCLCAKAWKDGRVLSRATDDLLHRRLPRISGHTGGSLLDPARELLPQVIDIVTRLDRTTLCIQGPPGTGKTFTAAAVIVELLMLGKRVGVAANSHKVILNLLEAVAMAGAGRSVPGTIYKVRHSEGDDDDHPLVTSGAVTLIPTSKDVPSCLNDGDGAVLVGGTAWVFSRPELQGEFDFLFIDEAGQVCLANAVAMGLSAKNLILIGDQMQLAQPTKGTHPGQSGLSCLEYLLNGGATVPPELGVFLSTSYRMHSNVCRFISDAIYDSRLTSFESANRHRVCRSGGVSLVTTETGIVWIPCVHNDCSQCSEQEAEAIRDITAELLGASVVGKDGKERRMRQDDILYVAPFNAQVRRLNRLLGRGARVGSVDKLQGQEAPVVIVSLCSSTLEEAPRGAGFLLSPNRLNVAISRAQALAIVVGSPELTRVRCKTVEEMKLVNLLCRVIHYAGQKR